MHAVVGSSRVEQRVMRSKMADGGWRMAKKVARHCMAGNGKRETGNWKRGNGEIVADAVEDR